MHADHFKSNFASLRLLGMNLEISDLPARVSTNHFGNTTQVFLFHHHRVDSSVLTSGFLSDLHFSFVLSASLQNLKCVGVTLFFMCSFLFVF